MAMLERDEKEQEKHNKNLKLEAELKERLAETREMLEMLQWQLRGD